jgi:hypothetical protein
MRTSWCGCLVAGVALTSAPVRAHHATAAEFDVTNLIVLQGTITKIEWINPHAWLYLDVKDPDGKITAWRIEGASMNAYATRKFPRESVTAGIEISITAYPGKNGANMADGATITFKNGTRIFFGGSAPVDGLDEDGRPCIFGRREGCRR